MLNKGSQSRMPPSRAARLFAMLATVALAATGVVLTGSAAQAATVQATYCTNADCSTTSTVTATVLDATLNGVTITNPSPSVFYVCNSTLTLGQGLNLNGAGTFNLILGDSCNLTVGDGVNNAYTSAFGVANGTILNVWGTPANSGQLKSYSKATSMGSGIGDFQGFGQPAPTLNFYGGYIYATGGGGSAGIGSSATTTYPASINILWRANVEAYGGALYVGSTPYGAGAGIGSGGSIQTTTWSVGPITINTSGMVRAFGGAAAGGFGSAANIGQGAIYGGNGATSIRTLNMSTATTVPASSATVQYATHPGTYAANATVTNVGVGSSVTYRVTPIFPRNLASGKGNNVAMPLLGGDATSGFIFRHAVTGTTTPQAIEFTTQYGTNLTLEASPTGQQSRPGDVTVTATLLNLANEGIANKTVTLTAVGGPGGSYTLTTDANGVATKTFTSPAVSTFTLNGSFAGDVDYAPATNSLVDYQVVRAAHTLQPLTLSPSVVYGDAPVEVTTHSLQSSPAPTGAWSLSSSALSVASVSAPTDTAGVMTGTVTYEQAGTFTVTASRAQDDNYLQASTTSEEVTVTAATPVLTLTHTETTTTAEPFTLTLTIPKRGAGRVPQGTVDFSLGGVLLDTVTLVDDGNGNAVATLSNVSPTSDLVEILAEFNGDNGRYLAGSAEATWSLTKVDQGPLAVADPGAKTFGDNLFTFGLDQQDSGSGTGAVTWQIVSGNNPAVLTLNATTGAAQIVGGGSVTVRATKASDALYNEKSADFTLTVAPYNLANLASIDVLLTGAPFTYQATAITPDASASFQGADGVTHTLSSSVDFDLSYGSNTNAGTNAGSVTLSGGSRASYTGSKTVQFNIAKAQPTLDFAVTSDGAAISSPFTLPGTIRVRATFGGQGTHLDQKAIMFEQTAGPSIDLGGTIDTASNGVALSNAIANPAAGSYSFTADFAGNTNYLAATASIAAFVVQLGTQSVSIAGVNANQHYADGPFTLSLAGKLGTGSMTFTSSDESVASASGSTLTILKAGTFTLNGSVAADSLYAAASAAPLIVTVAQADTMTALNASGGSTTAVPVVLTATVSTPVGSTQPVTGETVTFYEGATPLGTGFLNASGVATFTVSNPVRGDHDYTAEFGGLTDFYNVSTSAVVTVTVAGQAQQNFAIIAPAESDTVYGGPVFGPLGLAGKLGTGDVTWSVPVDNGVIEIDSTTGEITILAAGTVTVTADLAADPIFNAATANYSLTITKRAVTVVTDAQNMVFGDAVPTLTWNAQPALVGSDTLTGSLKLAGPIVVGQNQIVQNEPFANPNYQVTFQGATLTVTANPAQQEVINKIGDLPNPVETLDDADVVADVTNEYDNLSDDERVALPQDVIDALKKAQDEASDVNHRDAAAGAVVNGDELPWHVRLVIVRVPASDARFGSFEGRLRGGRGLVDLYEIHLINTLTGERWQPPTGHPVQIELSKVVFDGFTDIGMAHELVNGRIEVVPSQLNGNVIFFDGQSFSLYGVTGLRIGGLPGTGGEALLPLGLLTSGLLAGAGLLLVGASRKKKR